MKEAFVSDFDSTLTEEDFYLLVIRKYYSDGNKLHQLFEQEKITVSELLIRLFRSINQPEKTVKKDIQSIPLSRGAVEFIKEYSDRRGDFYILSAGCDYYIRELLKTHQLDERVQIFANPGHYQKNYLEMTPNPDSPFYSPESGIDKGKVISYLKTRYDQVAFAGDSRPDFSAAQKSDLVFAKKGASLCNLLEKYQIPYQAFEDFKDIARFF